MSAIIKFVAPVDLLFQPVQRERVSVNNSECELIWLEPIRAPEERFWKLPGQAVPSRVAMIELFVVVFFAVVALAGVVSCFSELSGLLGSDSIGQVAARVVSTSR
jgi:hypothetical protein